MILASLRDMAIREGLTHATAFENRPVRWIISLAKDGQFLALKQSLSGISPEQGKEKRKLQAKMLSIPRRSGRTAQTQSDFLVDKSEYVLGIEPEGRRPPEELAKRRRLFLDRTRAAAQATCLAELGAAVRFLESHTQRAQCIASLETEGYASNDLFTFEVDGQLLVSHPQVRRYWARLLKDLNKGPLAAPRQCVACGEMRQPVDKHDVIQIPGGVTSGVGLVTFNSAAFEKYGLERNQNAPVCRACMIAYVEALRRCLSDRYPRPDHPGIPFSRQSVRLTSDTTAIYWAATQSNLVEALAGLSDRPADLRMTTDSALRATANETIQHEPFHCLILSGSQGRAIVRSLHTTTLGSLVENLTRYFELISVAAMEPRWPRPLSTILASLAPAENADNLPPGLAKDIFLGAVMGLPLPRRVLSATVAKNAATQCVTPDRAAILHLYFGLQPSLERFSMSLDVNNPDPAYRLGRLLAILEAIQSQAHGMYHNKGWINRFYAAACKRPGSVFPRALQITQHNLDKLPNRSRDLRQKQIGKVIEGVVGFSPMQTLEEQGRFGLGYYHQRLANFQRATPDVAARPSTNPLRIEEGAQE